MANNIGGLAQFMRYLDNLETEIEQKAKLIVRDTTLKAMEDARRNAPVDTGYMRNHILATFESNGLVGLVTANADYSILVENGTSRMPARPFMYPSYFTNLDVFKREMERMAGGYR